MGTGGKRQNIENEAISPAGGRLPTPGAQHRLRVEPLPTSPHAVMNPLLGQLSGLSALERIQLITLWAFLFFAWESNARSEAALAALCVACCLDRRFWSCLRNSTVAWLTGALAGYIALRGGIAGLNDPQYLPFHLDDGRRLLLLSGFLLVAWALRGDLKRVYLSLLIALIGFWVGRFEHFHWLDPETGRPWWQTRQDFELSSAIAFGQYAAMAALGLMILRERIWGAVRGTGPKTAVIVLWLAAFAISVEGVILSQARGVWLALAVVLPVIAVAQAQARGPILGAKSVIVAAVVLAGVLVMAYLQHDTLEHRLARDQETTTLLLTGQFDEIPAEGNFGIRYHMLLFGWEHWQKNLLFGLGPGATEPLMKGEWTRTTKARPYSDLHNGYLEILLRLGLVGAGLFLALLILLVQGAWRAYRGQRIPWDLFLLLMTALALHLLGTLTNFRMLNIDWRHYWLLFGGILFSIHWFNRSSAAASPAKADTNQPAKPAGSEAPSRLSR